MTLDLADILPGFAEPDVPVVEFAVRGMPAVENPPVGGYNQRAGVSGNRIAFHSASDRLLTPDDRGRWLSRE
jgi:hypothetical protein